MCPGAFVCGLLLGNRYADRSAQTPNVSTSAFQAAICKINAQPRSSKTKWQERKVVSDPGFCDASTWGNVHSCREMKNARKHENAPTTERRCACVTNVKANMFKMSNQQQLLKPTFVSVNSVLLSVIPSTRRLRQVFQNLHSVQ